ncbi:MAG: MFS transporter [Armatimonadetes bacterium]|nr:MFS transporter [Armatimonadota bacterium]
MLERAPQGLIPRNYILGIVNGSLFFLFNAFIDLDIVLPGFAWQLTGGRPLWIGVLVSLIGMGWFWPQLFLAPMLATQPRLLPAYHLSAAVRFVALAAAAMVAWNLERFSPGVALLLITLCYALYSSGGGLSIIPFMTIVSDSVPPQWRGRFFGARYLIGGLLAFGAGFVVKWLLGEDSGYEFPHNYALLFTIGVAIAIPSMTAFCLVEEPPRAPQRRRLPIAQELRRGLRLTRRNRNFRRLLVTRGLRSLALGLTTPFIVPYALDALGVTPAAVGLFLGAKVLTYSLSNILWSRVGDQYGNRRLLVLSAMISLVSVALLLGVRFLPAQPVVAVAGLPLSWRGVLICLIFAGIGFSSSGQEIGYTNFLLEMIEERKRSVYLGFFYLYLAPLCWVPLLGAVLIGEHGKFMLGFWISAILTLVMTVYTFRLREVRDFAVPDEAQANRADD